jgi:hypothetical protein
MSIITDNDFMNLQKLAKSIGSLLHYIEEGKSLHILRNNEEEILLGMIEEKVDSLKEILDSIETHQSI